MAKINEIINGSEYDLSLFTEEQINKIDKAIYSKTSKSGTSYYLTCQVRHKDIRVTPEEVVRQLYILTLMEDYGYSASRMVLEYEVTFGREKKRADIVILDKEHTDTPYIIVEVKKPKLKEGKEQLKSYCNATGAPVGVWSNGKSISYYHRKDPNYFEDISNIPRADQKLSDIISERWTIDDLIKKDKLVNERKSLKDLILEMEDEVMANSGYDVFEEIFKLIFIKLYDEFEGGRKKDRNLEFRNYGDTESELKTRLQSLFGKAKEKWPGVFTDDDNIQLAPSHLSVCVSSLQDVKLFNSNLEVVDEAFEYLMSKSRKGEKGQYFTPRYVIDMCVKMLNPSAEEKMIDTAAGSCGFPVHTIFHVWQKILESKGIKRSHLFTLEKKPAECTDYVQNNVFAIDFDEKCVRVARTLNLIAGDGQTNVLYLNALDYERWEQDYVDGKTDWKDTYYEGWKKFKKLRSVKNENRDFQFDIVMANPPFAGDIKESRVIAKYDLGRSVGFDKLKSAPKGANIVEGMPTFPQALSASAETVYRFEDGTYCKAKIKQSANVSRDILFVERNLDFLRPGGRMAIVLPQGRFNNSSDKFLREYIASRCRILAVVGLHVNVFRPHTATKTSVLFVQKWDDELCPKVDNYNIFFATMKMPSKDNSGNKIYWKQTVISYVENHEIVEYSESEFNEKHGSIAKATYYLPLDEYKKNKDQIKEKNDDFMLNLHGVINGDEYAKLDVEEQAKYVNLKMPVIEQRPLLDSHGHLIVKHDLFNHDGLTEDGIAEAFAEFAKREGLSFFADAPLTR